MNAARQWADNMQRVFNVTVEPDENLRNGLARVHAEVKCNPGRFRAFIDWFFDCYVISAPKSPYALRDAWEAFVDGGECLPIVVRADRLESE